MIDILLKDRLITLTKDTIKIDGLKPLKLSPAPKIKIMAGLQMILTKPMLTKYFIG